MSRPLPTPARAPVSGEEAPKKAWWRKPSLHEWLWWCLPALLLGGALRLALTIHFPYGYVQGDTLDFLVTTERLLIHHALVLHSKKAFLSPILYTVPFLLHIPALIIIPLAQHCLGLVLTVLVGALTRWWFRHWRWFIVPATVLTTINPALLWMEHAILAECHYLFCVTALAAVGTVFALRPAPRQFVWLIVALLFTAGSRPEGKLFIAFGLLLVALVYWGNWREWAQRVAIMLVASALIWMSTRSNQAGVLLYATVLPLAPETSKVAPDFSPWINPLREKYVAEGATVRMKLTTAEKAISGLGNKYLHSIGQSDSRLNAFCQKLAVEAALHKPWLLPAIAANKFLMSCHSAVSGGYTEDWIHHKQIVSLLHRPWIYEIIHGLTGQDLKTKEDAAAFINNHYAPLKPDWFAELQKRWSTFTLAFHGKSRHVGDEKIPRLSYLFTAAVLGMLISLVRPSPLWRFHVPWLLTLGGVWFVVMLTGVVNARYRFVFEPFAILYALLFLDYLWIGAETLIGFCRPRGPAPAATHP